MRALQFDNADDVPRGLTQLFKAGLKRHRASEVTELPPLQASIQQVSIDPDRLAQFCALTHWPYNGRLPPTYLQILAMPLQMQMLLQPQFPFALLGLVHMTNHIEQARPIFADEAPELRCRLGEVAPHPRGQQISLITEAYCQGEWVWRAEIQTLVIQSQPGRDKAKKSYTAPDWQQQWALASNLGRRYARVSGDYNPIHLHTLTAKLFGFRQHIIHGLWTKARCLGAIHAQLPPAFSVEVDFKRPLFLPAEVGFWQTAQEQQGEFQVGDDQRLYLQGRWQAR